MTSPNAPADLMAGGNLWSAMADLHTVKGWLHGLATNPDLNDIVADGGITVGDCYQQEAREFAGRLGRAADIIRANSVRVGWDIASDAPQTMKDAAAKWNAPLPSSAEAASPAGEGRDYPAEFEAWWATYRHRNRDVADYNIKKQIAFDAFYFAALAPTASPELAGAVERLTAIIDAPLDCYDAGLLGFGGGGDIDWWHDYLRAELERADHHYRAQMEAMAAQANPVLAALAGRG